MNFNIYFAIASIQSIVLSQTLYLSHSLCWCEELKISIQIIQHINNIPEFLEHAVHYYLLSLAASELRANAKITRRDRAAITECWRNRQFAYILLPVEMPRTISSGQKRTPLQKGRRRIMLTDIVNFAASYSAQRKFNDPSNYSFITVSHTDFTFISANIWILGKQQLQLMLAFHFNMFTLKREIRNHRKTGVIIIQTQRIVRKEVVSIYTLKYTLVFQY
jgi:hypothetical protein